VADLTDDRITLAGLLMEAAAALTCRTVPTLEAHGLAPQWFEALLRLARSPEGRLRMSDLAGAMTSISPSGLTRLVDRLEAEGLVRREQCPTDRRSAYAVITEAGSERVLEVLPAHLEDLDRSYVSLFNDREARQLERLLRRIRDAEPAGRHDP
jgi:MarR family transcriptional regulator, 2-MHQ and catechol-resistance regulon repressor